MPTYSNHWGHERTTICFSTLYHHFSAADYFLILLNVISLNDRGNECALKLSETFDGSVPPYNII